MPDSLNSQAGDRRPIAARQLGASQAAAAFLLRRQVSPNAVSLAGMAAGMLGGLAFAATSWVNRFAFLLWLAAALLVQCRLIANMLDGMVAIGGGTASPLGEIYNDVPDRAADSAILLGFGVAAGSPALGLAAALAAMATAYIRVLGRALGAPSDFRGPMAKQHRMAAVTGFAILACVLPARWIPACGQALLWLIVVLALVTAARRLAGAARHLKA
jgi:phosphatidylglycerophosphate synthase